MGARHCDLQALVFGRHDQGERYWRYQLFDATEGPVEALWRRSQQASPRATPPDLFHELEVALQSSGGSRAWFIGEHRVIWAPDALGRSYAALQEASQFTRTLWQNLRHAEHFGPLYTLARNALEAFASGVRPEVAHFKALYLFAKEEGYPVKEEWWTGLPAASRALVAGLLQHSLGEQTASEEQARIQLAALQRYLRGSTDILVPG
ncbi:MAG: hypothetical protein ACLFU2_14600 [Opitutales bacterium]